MTLIFIEHIYKNAERMIGMKKTIWGALLAAVLLAGCGAGNDMGNEADNVLQTMPENVSIMQNETIPETQPQTQGVVKAEFSHDNIYISLELPAGWEYEITEYDETKEEQSCGIIFRPTGSKDIEYELYYHTFFGLCGTGVTIEELHLENGMKIWKYSETIDKVLWRNIVFEYEKDENERGSYVLCYFGDEEEVLEYEEELGKIMETIVVSR